MKDHRSILGTLLYLLLYFYGNVVQRGYYVIPNHFLGVQVTNLPAAVINERRKIILHQLHQSGFEEGEGEHANKSR